MLPFADAKESTLGASGQSPQELLAKLRSNVDGLDAGPSLATWSAIDHLNDLPHTEFD
jgi:hypothetical protein